MPKSKMFSITINVHKNGSLSLNFQFGKAKEYHINGADELMLSRVINEVGDVLDELKKVRIHLLNNQPSEEQ